MREIKFRAWDTKNKRFVNHDGGFGGLGDFFIELSHNPNVFILLQYTGLKDKNGKEIYDGDILRDCEYQEIVVAAWSQEDDWGIGFILEYPENCVVIGNIYQNPKLLTSA